MTPDDMELLKELASNEGSPLMTDAGKAKLAELRAQFPSDPAGLGIVPDPIERGLIGAGRGFMDTYQGAKQKSLQAEDVATGGQASQEYTDRVNREMEPYSALEAGYPTSTGIGRFVGNAASFPYLGRMATFPIRMLESSALGGLLGGAQFDPENKATNTLKNAALGSFFSGLLEGGSSAVRGMARGQGGMPVPSNEVPPPSIGMAGAQAFERSAAGAPGRRYDYYDPEFNIPYTEGQANENLRRQQLEQRTLHGAFGQEAEQDLQASLDYQARRSTDAMRETGADIIQGDRTGRLVPQGSRGGREYMSLPDAGDYMKSQLGARANKMYADMGDLFSEARAAGGYIDAQEAQTLIDRTMSYVDENHLRAMTNAPKQYPVSNGVIEQLRAFIPDFAENQTAQMDAAGLHEMRKIISNARNDKSTNNTERKVLGEMLEGIDQETLRLVEIGALRGPEAAITKMREGIKMRADYGKLYGPRGKRTRSGRNLGDKAGDAIERIIETDMTGEEVANLVFGKGRLGSNQNSGRIIKRISEAAGKDSDEVAGLRNMAMEKLVHDVTRAGQEEVSAQKLATAWGKLRRSNTDLVGALFTNDEVAKIDRLVKAIGKTRYMDRAQNNSRTFHMLESMFKQGPNAIGAAVGAAAGSPAGAPFGALGAMGGMWVAGQVGDTIRNTLARMYGVRMYEKPPRSLPPSIGAATGSLVDREYMRPPRGMGGQSTQRKIGE